MSGAVKHIGFSNTLALFTTSTAPNTTLTIPTLSRSFLANEGNSSFAVGGTSLSYTYPCIETNFYGATVFLGCNTGATSAAPVARLSKDQTAVNSTIIALTPSAPNTYMVYMVQAGTKLISHDAILLAHNMSSTNVNGMVEIYTADSAGTAISTTGHLGSSTFMCTPDASSRNYEISRIMGLFIINSTKPNVTASQALSNIYLSTANLFMPYALGGISDANNTGSVLSVVTISDGAKVITTASTSGQLRVTTGFGSERCFNNIKMGQVALVS
jgi:hypothetical protein